MAQGIGFNKLLACVVGMTHLGNCISVCKDSASFSGPPRENSRRRRSIDESGCRPQS